MSIISRKRADGTTGHTVQIQRKRNNKIVLNLVQTFDRLPAAEAWERRKKEDLAKPGGLDSAIAEASKKQNATLENAIDRALRGRTKVVGKTTIGNLNIVKRFPIAQMACEAIQSHNIVELAQELAAGERAPQTVGNILSSLGKVFTLGRPMWNLPLNEQAMADALVGLRELGWIARSRQRKRRPTLEELDRLMVRFVDRSHRANALPMHRITAFAIFSTRRLGEICRILWDDFEEDHEDGPRILVRDMKHPGEKEGNDVWCRLTPESVEIIKAMPRVDARIFPTRRRRRVQTSRVAAKRSASWISSLRTRAATLFRDYSRWARTSPSLWNIQVTARSRPCSTTSRFGRSETSILIGSGSR